MKTSGVAAVGLLVATVAVTSSVVPARGEHDAGLTDDEVKCQLAASLGGAKFVRDKVRCVLRCRRKGHNGLNPASECLFPYSGRTAACVARAESKAIDFITRACARDCPECYPGGGDCAVAAAVGVGTTETQLDLAGSLVFCTDPGHSRSLTPREARCQDTVAKVASDFAIAKLLCLRKCRADEHKGKTAVGSCAPPPMSSEAAACIARAADKAAALIDGRCGPPAGDVPECYSGGIPDSGAGWVTLAEIAVDATDAGTHCRDCAHDKCETGEALSPSCDSCVASICAVDPYCCNVFWDQICVGEVGSVCGLSLCPVCGDGVVGPGEVCDPPGSAVGCPAGQTCDFLCSGCVTLCGDGVVGPGEVCDPPGSTDGCPAGQACNFFCSGCATVCGDGVVGPGEVCDPPGSTNGCAAGQTCDFGCGGCISFCGDGVAGPGEACDPPQQQDGCASGNICSPDCQVCAPCPAATPIPAGGGTFTGTTGGSSVLGSCGGSMFAPEQVFEWVPSASGLATVETCGGVTNYDTVLYVREGSCGGPELACNDDACGLSSQVTADVTAGQTYTIVVDGFFFGSGDFTLTVMPPSPSGAFLEVGGDLVG